MLLQSSLHSAPVRARARGARAMGQVGGVVVAFHKSDGGGQEGSREGRPEQSVCFFLKKPL